MDQRIRLGVLWKNTTREGNRPYLSGRVDLETLDAAVELLRTGGRFLVLSNNKRPDKRDPDCVLLVVPDNPVREGRASDAPAPASERRAPAGASGPGTGARSRTAPGNR